MGCSLRAFHPGVGGRATLHARGTSQLMEVMRMEEMAGRQGQHDRKRLLTAKVDSQMQEETRAALSHIIELHKKQRSEVCVGPPAPAMAVVYGTGGFAWLRGCRGPLLQCLEWPGGLVGPCPPNPSSLRVVDPSGTRS